MNEIKNIFNEKFIDNSTPVPGINQEKYNSYDQFQDSKNNSIIQISEKIASNNFNYSTDVIQEESKGNSAPLFHL